MATEKIPRMGTINQASRESGLPYGAIRRLILEGKLTYITVGNRYLLNLDRFSDFLNGTNENE